MILAWLKCAFPALILSCAVLFPAPSPASDYLINPKDVLEIKVYGQPDLTQEVRVSEEGHITLALVGGVTASGLTISALVKLLTSMYDEFFFNPEVSVFIREYYANEIYVLGEVQRPGLIKIIGKPTVLELLTQAGGFTPTGGNTLTLIRRSVKGKNPEVQIINLVDLLADTKQENNVEVRDGDTLYVARADYFFVFGSVSKPGSYKLEKDMNMNVMMAISLAGGFTSKAAKGKIQITRVVDGVQTNFKADMKDAVLPQDIVVVPESFF